MDVMKPELVWVEGGCYRFFDSHVWRSSNIHESCSETVSTQDRKRESVAPQQMSEREIDDPSAILECGPAVPCTKETKEYPTVDKKALNPEIKIERNARGKFCCSLYIAQRYYPFIVGFNGRNKSKLERETRTVLHVPRQPGVDCTITAHRKSDIVLAIDRLNEIIAKARTKVDPIHCLSIPMTDGAMKENLAKFKDAVVNEYNNNTQVLGKAVFIIPERLHLKLGMLLLVDEKDSNAAFEALAEWKQTILTPIIEKNGPVKIKVEGLDWLTRASPNAYVIFGKVSSENNALQELAQQTAQLFVEKGLMLPEGRKCTELHMELLHIPVTVDKGKDCRDTKENIASEIVSAHKDHFFGETELTVLHLSHCLKYDDNGYYATEAKIGV